MTNFKLNSALFKVSVPKTKRKKKDTLTRISNKIVKGKVFVDEKGIYKISINLQNDPFHPDYRVLEFTERSYELKGRTTVFGKVLDERRIVRYIRSEFDAKVFPGLQEQYIPFAPNWIVEGYIVKEGNFNRFDFKELVSLSGYETVVIEDE